VRVRCAANWRSMTGSTMKPELQWADIVRGAVQTAALRVLADRHSSDRLVADARRALATGTAYQVDTACLDVLTAEDCAALLAWVQRALKRSENDAWSLVECSDPVVECSDPVPEPKS
jgi:hypothetical protein